jgi:hypothetical protein
LLVTLLLIILLLLTLLSLSLYKYTMHTGQPSVLYYTVTLLSDAYSSHPPCSGLLLTLCLSLFSAITGQPSVLYYTVTLLSNAGLSSMASVYIALFKLAMTLISAAMVDQYGRKVMPNKINN